MRVIRVRVRVIRVGVRVIRVRAELASLGFGSLGIRVKGVGGWVVPGRGVKKNKEDQKKIRGAETNSGSLGLGLGQGDQDEGH